MAPDPGSGSAILKIWFRDLDPDFVAQNDKFRFLSSAFFPNYGLGVQFEHLVPDQNPHSEYGSGSLHSVDQRDTHHGATHQMDIF